MKKLLLILLCLPILGFGQNVYIPDANFKAYLVGEPSINTNGDSEIQVSEATAFNGSINCANMNIADLTGIEYFTSLTELNCKNNQLTSLDVNSNTALLSLRCFQNDITSLDVSNNTSLTALLCGNQQLINLDVRNGNNTYFTSFSATGSPNLYCINVDDVAWSSANWTNIDPQQYFSNNCPPTSIQEQTTNKELLKVTDLLGRETKETNQTNQPLLYLYDDGTVDKRIVIE